MVKVGYIHLNTAKNNNAAKYLRRQQSRRIASKKKHQIVTTVTGDYVLNYKALTQHCAKVANRITKKHFKNS